jgi:hypothetical protein
MLSGWTFIRVVHKSFSANQYRNNSLQRFTSQINSRTDYEDFDQIKSQIDQVLTLSQIVNHGSVIWNQKTIWGKSQMVSRNHFYTLLTLFTFTIINLIARMEDNISHTKNTLNWSGARWDRQYWQRHLWFANHHWDLQIIVVICKSHESLNNYSKSNHTSHTSQQITQKQWFANDLWFANHSDLCTTLTFIDSLKPFLTGRGMENLSINGNQTQFNVVPTYHEIRETNPHMRVYEF